MTILSSIYKGMSGLLGFTKALDNLSNNVANINTPGYKGRDVFFRELSSNFDSVGDGNRDTPEFSTGQGVQVLGSAIRFAEGDINQTGNNGDLAISGGGFFVLRDGSDVFYTRSGQFRADAQGFLVDPATGYRVAGLNSSGDLVDINLQNGQTNPAIATTRVGVSGSLAASSTTDTVFPDAASGNTISFDVFNADGSVKQLQLQFTKLSGNRWQADFLDANGSTVAASHIIEFNGLGAPLLNDQEYDLAFELFDYINEDIVTEQLSLVAPVDIVGGDLTSANPLELDLTSSNLVTLDNTGNIQFLDGGGEFSFDAEGFLRDSQGNRLASRTADGVLEALQVLDAVSIDGQPSSVVNVSGVLDASAVNGTVFPPLTDSAFEFMVIAANGDEETIQLRFEKSSDNEWQIILTSAQGNITRPAERLNFLDLAGSNENTLRADNRIVDVNFNFGSGNIFNFSLDFGSDTQAAVLVESAAVGAQPELTLGDIDGNVGGMLSQISLVDSGVLNFSYDNGEEALGPQLAVVQRDSSPVSDVVVDFSSLTNSSATAQSNVSVADVDGRTSGQLVSFDFASNGEISDTFSNGVVAARGQIALAMFANLNGLESISDTLFHAGSSAKAVYGTPENGAFGSIAVDSLELSNVELSREFAEIIIVQRGYQASSQVLNATNEMIEDLYNSVRGR